MEKQVNFLFNFGILKSVKILRDTILQRTNTIVSVADNLNGELACWAKEIAKAMSPSYSMKWEYVIDSATGVKILKSEKDPEALDRARQMSDDLFK